MINHRIMADAVDFYTGKGYQYVDVPWLVDTESAQMAAPRGVRQFETFAGFLPASGEQSFYHLLKAGHILPGNWQTITPCFRDEKSTNDIVCTHFMKLELFSVGHNLKQPRDVCDAARGFMSSYNLHTRIDDMPDGSMDIISSDNVELGSYGSRDHNGLVWTYGTGVAEPRFSTVLGRNTRKLSEIPDGTYVYHNWDYYVVMRTPLTRSGRPPLDDHVYLATCFLSNGYETLEVHSANAVEVLQR